MWQILLPWLQRIASLAENEGSVLSGAKVSALKILRPALTVHRKSRPVISRGEARTELGPEWERPLRLMECWGENA